MKRFIYFFFQFSQFYLCYTFIGHCGPPRSSLVVFRIHCCKFFVEDPRPVRGHQSPGVTLTSIRCHCHFIKSFWGSMETAHSCASEIFSGIVPLLLLLALNVHHPSFQCVHMLVLPAHWSLSSGFLSDPLFRSHCACIPITLILLNNGP